jgi:hypothetical protein
VHRPVSKASEFTPFNRVLPIDRLMKRDRARNAAVTIVLVAVLGIAGLVLGSDFRGSVVTAADSGPSNFIPAFVLSALRSF